MTISMVAVIVLIVWYAVWFGNTVVNNGKDYIIRWPLVTCSSIFTLGCLYCTGFFDVWRWPQFIYLVLAGIGVGVNVGSGGEIKSKHNALSSFIAYAIIWFIYYKGGVLNCFLTQ